jgi:hypothetical protein
MLTVTDQDRKWHAQYDMLPRKAKADIDEAYTAARDVLRRQGWSTNGDVRAEVLVAAITRYALTCRPEPTPVHLPLALVQ